MVRGNGERALKAIARPGVNAPKLLGETSTAKSGCEGELNAEPETVIARAGAGEVKAATATVTAKASVNVERAAQITEIAKAPVDEKAAENKARAESASDRAVTLARAEEATGKGNVRAAVRAPAADGASVAAALLAAAKAAVHDVSG